MKTQAIGIAGAFLSIREHFDKQIEAIPAPKIKTPKPIGTVIIPLTRFVDGIEYELTAEVEILSFYEGRKSLTGSDPSEAETGDAFVTEDVKDENGELVFRSGETIDLSENDEKSAGQQARNLKKS